MASVLITGASKGGRPVVNGSMLEAQPGCSPRLIRSAHDQARGYGPLGS